MKRTIRVTFDGEVFRPEEPVELQSNTTLFIILTDTGSEAEGVDSSGVLDDIAALASDLDDLPEDLSAQLDHYLYGHPKR